MTLTFDPVGHVYRLDGAIVPSVTQILAPCYSFNGIPPATLEHKRQIGEALDIAIQLDLTDDLVEESIAPELVGYVEAFRRFRVEKKFVAVATQKPVVSEKYRYAGTPDAWGSIEGHNALADWKAVYSMNPAVSLQTAGYHAAGVEMGYFKQSTRRYGVQFCPDGKYNIEPYENKNDFYVFLSFLSCRNWMARNGLL